MSIYVGPAGKCFFADQALSSIPTPTLIRHNGSRTRFLLYANKHCVGFRDRAFDMLGSIGQTFFTGCSGLEKRGTLDEKMAHENWNNRANKEATPYRFKFCAENSNAPGYVTEKLVLAFQEGAIPIWYGTPDVFKVFNRDAIVFWDPDNPQVALDRVRYLESNRTAYDEIWAQPVLVKVADYSLR